MTSIPIQISWLIEDGIGVLEGPDPTESPEVQHQIEAAGFMQVVTVKDWIHTMAWRLPDSGLRNFMRLANERLPAEKISSLPWQGMHFMDWAQMVYHEAQARTRKVK